MQKIQLNRIAMAVAMSTITTLSATGFANDEQETTELNEFVVWGTEVSTTDADLSAEAWSIKQADHISDLLRSVAGVDVGGAHSLNQGITIRSLSDTALDIRIDGAVQNANMFHHMGNLQIHADILKAADVQIGANSVVNGGLGGAIKFTTKSAKDLLNGQSSGGRIGLSSGLNSGTSASITAFSELGEQGDVLVYYHQLDRSDFKVGGGKILDANDQVVAGTDGHVRGLAGKLNNVLVKFGSDLTENQRLEIGYEQYRDSGDYSFRPDMGLATDMAIANNLDLPLLYATKFDRDTLTAKYELFIGDHTVIDANAYHNVSTLWRDQKSLDSWVPGYGSIVSGKAQNQGGSIVANSQFGDKISHDVTIGADARIYKTAYAEITNDYKRADADEALYQGAVYAEDKVNVGYGFTVIPGVRFDHYNPNATLVNKAFNQFGGSLALQYDWQTKLQVRLSSTTLFNAPQIGEVFNGAGLFETPNEEIKAETGLNSQVEIAFNSAVLGKDTLNAKVTVFNTDINDHIDIYAVNPAGGYWNDNVGTMNILGYEAVVGYQIADIQVKMSVSDAQSTLEAYDDYADIDGSRIAREQGLTYTASLDYLVPVADVQLHWDAQFVDSVEAAKDLGGASKSTAKDSFTVHNISAQWHADKLAKGLSLTLGVDNLFDEFYASQSSRTGVTYHPRFGDLYLLDYEPGRNIKASLAMQF